MNYDKIENKFLLLDSNVVINYSRFVPSYEGLFNELDQNNVNLVIDPFVRFEVLQYAKNKSEREDLENEIFENLFNGDDLSTPTADRELYELAVKISNLYQAKVDRSSKISTVDTFLAARMVKYNREEEEQDLFFATENHHDFPQEIFERIGIETIDREDQIHNIGFYKVKEGVRDILD